MRISLATTLLLFSVPAFAQQPTLTPNQNVAQMLGSQLGLCFSGNATLQEQVAKLTVDLGAAQAKIKELEGKTEDKK